MDTVAIKNVLLDRVVTGGVIAELQKSIAADGTVKINVHLHPHLRSNLHLDTRPDSVECKLVEQNVLQDCVVVYLVGAEPQKSIAAKGGVKASARVILPLIIIH